MMYMWIRYGKPDISMIANGLLAGLVAITAPCAFVNSRLWPLSSALIAGILVCVSVFFVERTLKVDDPVGAISVHGVNGAWGVSPSASLPTAPTATVNGVAGGSKGLFYGGGSQFAAQLIGTADEHHLRVHCVMFVLFKILDKIVGLRVSAEVEIEGLDQAEVAVTAYPDFQTRHDAPIGGDDHEKDRSDHQAVQAR